MTEYIISDTTMSHAAKFSCIPIEGEIIRCRDCKHFDENIDPFIGKDGSEPKCNRSTYVFQKHEDGIKWLHRPIVSPNGFCSWAERRE